MLNCILVWFQATAGKFLVCAIDFGTTYSGWASSFMHEYQSDPTKVSQRRWYSASETLSTAKTPTCALIAPDGKTLVAFGYDAENKYQKLAEQGEHENYYYLRRFKMALAKEKISRDLEIKDEMGKPLKAITVFSLSIGHLANDMIEASQKTITGEKILNKSDVNWVLTVPAIWSDAAKQFMREAAQDANIDMEKLEIVFEPEAASVYCRYIPVQSSEDKLEISKMSAGTQYLILDAGGGTIDVTVHEVNASGGLKEMHKASGGGWGGILVDKAFEDVLVEILGRNVYDKFVRKETEDWLDFWRSFETKKRNLCPDNDDRVPMKLPVSLTEIVEEETASTMKDKIKESKYSNEVEIRRDKIYFSGSLMKSLFDNSIKTTVAHVKSVLEHPAVKNNETIVMVGGFSESCILQDAIKKAFHNFKVIIPPEAATSILRGAVIVGHNPKAITERVLKKTYGVKTTKPFDANVDPESKRNEVLFGLLDNVHMFHKHVEKGQTVIVGETQRTETYYPMLPFQDEVALEIYASDLNNPKYIDEGCDLVGRMRIDLSDIPDDEKQIEAKISFSDTEIHATARVVKTGQKITAKFNFLG